METINFDPAELLINQAVIYGTGKTVVRCAVKLLAGVFGKQIGPYYHKSPGRDAMGMLVEAGKIAARNEMSCQRQALAKLSSLS